MEEKINVNNRDWREAAFREIAAQAKIPYPDKEITAAFNDPKLQELHNRAKKLDEVEAITSSFEGKYHVKDSRFARIVSYFLKEENSPENIEYNRKFVDELNTPEGAQRFVDNIVKDYTDNDRIYSFVSDSVADMIENTLNNHVRFRMGFLVNDLIGNTGNEQLYTIDPEAKKKIEKNIPAIQAGANLLSVTKLMGTDWWPYLFNSAMEKQKYINLVMPATMVHMGYKDDEKEKASEIFLLASNPVAYTGLDEMGSWKLLKDKGLLKGDKTMYLDGKEITPGEAQKHIEKKGADALDDITAIPNVYLNEESLAADKRNHDGIIAFMEQMEQSQRDIWGNGSPEFAAIMTAVAEYREASSNKTGGELSGMNPKLNKLLIDISKKADVYLNKKKGVSLNANGRKRFDMVTGLKELADNASNRKYQDMIEYHSELKELGINSTTVSELKAKMEEPEAKKLHEAASKYVRAVNRVTMKATDAQYGSENGYNVTGLKRLFHYYLDFSGTPEAEKRNREFMESIKTPDGRQKLTNHIAKTLLETPDEYFFAETIQEGAKRYIDNPMLAELAFVACDLINDADSLLTDNNLRKELESKLALYQNASWYKFAANLMARDDWGLLDVKTDAETAGMFNAMTMRKGGTNDPYKVVPNEEPNKTNEYGQVLVALAQNVPTAIEDARIIKENSNLFKPGTEYVIDGNPVRLTDAIEKIKNNEKNGLAPLEGLTATVNEKYLSDLNNSLATADTGDYYIKPYISPRLAARAAEFKERDDVAAFLDRMEASQGRLRSGNGSPEFRSLMDAVRDYRNASAKMAGKYSRDNPEMVDKLTAISERAETYLKKKEGASLNKNGTERFELVTELKNLTDGMNRYDKMLKVHRRHFRNTGMTLPTAGELSRLSNDPEGKAIHERAREIIGKRDADEAKQQEIANKYQIPGFDNTGVSRIYMHFIDTADTPEADEYNRRYLQEIATPEGKQKLLNFAVKTFLEMPNEFFLPKNSQEAARNYAEYPELTYVAFAATDIFSALKTKDFSMDETILKAFDNKLSYIMGAASLRYSVQLMAREDWPLLAMPTKKAEIEALGTNIMMDGDFQQNDIYDYGARENGGHQTSPAANIVMGPSMLTSYFVSNEKLGPDADIFKNGAEITKDGKALPLDKALEAVEENVKSGREPLDGLKVSVDENRTREIADKLAALDTGSFRLGKIVSKAPEVKPVAQEADKAVQEPEKNENVKQEEPKPEVKEEPKPEVKEEPRPEVKEEPRPEVKEEPKPAAKKSAFNVSPENLERYKKGMEEMSTRHASLEDGTTYKKVLGMAIEARGRIFNAVITGKPYAELGQDIKTMVSERALYHDMKDFKGQTCKQLDARQEEKSRTDPGYDAAERFVTGKILGPTMDKIQALANPVRDGNGKKHYRRELKTVMEQLAFRDADLMVKDCNKGITEQKKLEESLQKQQQLNNQLGMGGPGMGK